MPEESKTKPRVVIDTNVFVSGLNFKGKPRDVLDLIWKEVIEVYISPFILQELRDTLGGDFDWSVDEINEIIEKIMEKTHYIKPEVCLHIIKEKEDDNRILECAIEVKARYLITGDKRHLLPLKEYHRVKIMSPADFLKLKDQ